MIVRFLSLLLVVPFNSAFSQQPGSTGSDAPAEIRAEHDRVAAARVIPTNDFEQFAPYWTAESGWHTELQLRNNLALGNLVVTPSLRTADGSETRLNAVTLLPGEVRSIDLMDALSAVNSTLAGKANAFGAVVLRYNSKASRNLYASVMVHDAGHPIMYHLDAMIQAPRYVTGSREGIWWLPTKATHDYLVLTNQSDNPLQGTLWLYDAAGKPWSQPLQLGARQTQRVSVRDLVSAAGFWGQYGGIKVEMPQGAGSIDTVHILYDEASGFSATMKMFDYDPRVKIAERDYAGKGVWATRAPMLALSNPDPVLALPEKTVFQPMLLVRNTAAHPAKVSLGFHWRNSSTDGRTSLPETTIAPYETWKVDVRELQSKGTIPIDASWAQVTLTTNTAPDDVMAIAASYDETLRYGVQTPFSDQLIRHLEGGEWKVDATHTSLIAAGNGGDKPVQTALTIFYNEGRQQYRIEKTIAADDQWWVDVGALIRNQTSDKNGQTLPAGLTFGAYQLREIGSDPQNTLYEGKVITDKTYGHATYGCMTCCGYGGDAGPPFIVDDPTNLLASGTASVDVYGTNACTGVNDLLDAYFPTWSSSNTAVMTTSHFSVNGIAVGSARLLANATRMPSGQGEDQRTACPMAPALGTGNGNVLSLICSPATRGASTTCAATGPPGTIFSNWTFTDGTSIISSTSGSSLNTWTGIAVTSGVVTVVAKTPDGGQTALPAALAVTPRSGWAYSAQASTRVSALNPALCANPPALPTTPNPVNDVGDACAYINTVNSQIQTATALTGPNQGYQYVPSEPTDGSSFTWVIAGDIDNPGSAFYQAQCGNYNVSTNAKGFTSGPTLDADTQRHEGGSVNGHYGNYVAAIQMPANNLGTQLEALIAPPSVSLSSIFAATLKTINQSVTAYGGEPCGTHVVSYNAACVFDGNVNYSPYQSCHQE